MNDRSEHDDANPSPGGRRRYVAWQDMTWKDYVRITAGVVMFVLGIVGLVLPILQGVLFLIISAILLAPYSRWVSKQLDRGERRFPWISAKARSITQRWRRKADRHDPS
jgi:membrane protein implicated in regulation of membrane protease activity